MRTVTQTIEEYEVVLPQDPSLEARRVLLVDTPGLNDPSRSDAETLESIGQWVVAMQRYVFSRQIDQWI